MAAELGRTRCVAEVVAVVSQAVYLRDSEGRIFWLSPSGGTPHRRAVLAPPTSGWRVGATCSVSDGLLCAEGGARVDLTDAQVWREPMPQKGGVSREHARQALRVALRILCQITPARGLARLTVSGRDRAPRGDGHEASLVASWAEDAAGRVVLALEGGARDTGTILGAADRLVGLGEGLTPSGDDFLGGLLFTLRYVSGACCGRSPLDWDAIDGWVRKVEPWTSAISHAMLSDLASGHGPEPLHEVICAIAAGAPPDRIALPAARLIEVGQTSGWDMLAGVAAGLDVVSVREVDEGRRRGDIGGRADLPVGSAAGERIAVRGAHGD